MPEALYKEIIIAKVGGVVYLLYLFGPLWGVTKCHEYTVGQNRTHDDHAEQREEAEVKENMDSATSSHTFHKH